MGTALCERCAQLVEDLSAYVRRLSREIVEKIKECIQAIAQCCCMRRKGKGTIPRTSYKPLVQEHERLAAQELVQHLGSGSESVLLGNDCLQALNTLAVSENNELQQSAAVYLLHLSEHLPTALPSEFLEPYPALLRSCDVEVQRTTSLSLVNLLVDHNVNKELIVEMGTMEPILDLLESGDLTVQCNSCACVAMLATSDANREAIMSGDGVLRILVLAKSYDPRIQRNAVGALLNLTRSERVVGALCQEGVLPVLALLLQSADVEVQFYSCSALRNVAAVQEHHSSMLGIGDRFLLKSLLSLLSSPVEKNSCQACLCLRNFSENVQTQEELMALGCVPPLTTMLRSPAVGKSESAITLLSALSQHPPNRDGLVEEGLVQAVDELLLLHSSRTTVLSLGAVTVANLSTTPTGQQAVMDSHCVSRLLTALDPTSATEGARICIASCLHHLTCLELLKPHIAEKMTAEHISHLVRYASQEEIPELSFHAACIIGELGMNVAPLLRPHCDAVLGYLLQFLKSPEVRFQQLAIATLSTLKNDECFAAAVSGSAVQEQLCRVRAQTEKTSKLLSMVSPTSPSTDQPPSAQSLD
ncbi:hypothetical protein ANANG_G00017680 [Anguilla anguilla]|uniref:Vacuolar protein 8 n=1 Tax=Anguilla anguilla TaxID=7936 RepID=A0A9D3MYJ9_ANGAN|nr:hypothetical protein ANANG_G00017680 [Anguilla anguilla]